MTPVQLALLTPSLLIGFGLPFLAQLDVSDPFVMARSYALGESNSFGSAFLTLGPLMLLLNYHAALFHA